MFEKNIFSKNESQEKARQKMEILAGSQMRRVDLLKRILFSRTADIAGNYIPGLDVIKMTAESIRGRTLGQRELPPMERIGFILSVALIAAFYATGDFRLRLGASAAFDAVMIPQIFKEISHRVSEVMPRMQPMLESAREFLMKNENAKEIWSRAFASAANLTPLP